MHIHIPEYSSLAHLTKFGQVPGTYFHSNCLANGYIIYIGSSTPCTPGVQQFGTIGSAVLLLSA